MARATRAAPVAVSRVGGMRIAPATSAVLVIAVAVAIGMSAGIAGVGRLAASHDSGAIEFGGAANRLLSETAAVSGARAPGAATIGHVPDVPWLADRGDGIWLFGHGATARTLPAAEFGLAIDDRYVATSTPGPNRRSTVRLRSTSTGAVVRDIQAPIWVSAAAWTQRGLVITGYGDSTMRSDGGLVLVTADGPTEVLVPPAAFSPELGRPVARGDVYVSPSRQVVASNICDVERCDSQVVDLATGTTFRPARAAVGFLRAVTDDTVVTTDADAQWISARRFGDGHEVWRLRDTLLLDPMPASRGSLLGVVGSRATGWGIDTIDAAGKPRRLTPRVGADAPWPRVWPQLSTSDRVVIGHEPFDEAVAAGKTVDVEVYGTDAAAPASPMAARFQLSVGAEATR